MCRARAYVVNASSWLRVSGLADPEYRVEPSLYETPHAAWAVVPDGFARLGSPSAKFTILRWAGPLIVRACAGPACSRPGHPQGRGALLTAMGDRIRFPRGRTIRLPVADFRRRAGGAGRRRGGGRMGVAGEAEGVG